MLASARQWSGMAVAVREMTSRYCACFRPRAQTRRHSSGRTIITGKNERLVCIAVDVAMFCVWRDDDVFLNFLFRSYLYSINASLGAPFGTNTHIFDQHANVSARADGHPSALVCQTAENFRMAGGQSASVRALLLDEWRFMWR